MQSLQNHTHGHVIPVAVQLNSGLASRCTVRHEMNYNGKTTDAQVEKHLGVLAEAEFLAIGGDGTIDDRLLDLCPNVKVVSVVGVGYDGVDLDAMTRRGVWLANAPVLREACADMALLLMLSAMREAAIGYSIAKNAEAPHGWDWRTMRNVVGQDPGGKTLGLIGLGRIGQTFAAKAQAAFNMKVIYFDPVTRPPNRTSGDAASGGRATKPYWELEPPPQWVSFEELLATSDVISMHANLSKHSRRMMGKAEFNAMKPTAYFVNMARGGLVDEEALAEALATGEIAGAGIDTFEQEPNIHPKLVAQDRAFILPHIASATDDTRFAMAARCLDNARRVIDGGAPVNPINAPPAAVSSHPSPTITAQHTITATADSLQSW